MICFPFSVSISSIKCTLPFLFLCYELHEWPKAFRTFKFRVRHFLPKQTDKEIQYLRKVKGNSIYSMSTKLLLLSPISFLFCPFCYLKKNLSIIVPLFFSCLETRTLKVKEIGCAQKNTVWRIVRIMMAKYTTIFMIKVLVWKFIYFLKNIFFFLKKLFLFW